MTIVKLFYRCSFQQLWCKLPEDGDYAETCRSRLKIHILIIRANTKHYFSTLFGKELYLFRTDLLSIIRSLNTVFTAICICHTSYVDCLLADSQHN